ncbi:MAG: ABC transporter ATP-binding protein [Kiritimatiellia bacterium]
MSGADINVVNCRKNFPVAQSDPVAVLKGVSFDLLAGHSLAITGASGSGKSTLLQILGAMEYPSSGGVFINGRDITRLDQGARAEFRNREVGFIFQSHYLLPQLSALDNVLVPTWNSRRESDQHLARAHELLERVGLESLARRLPGQLSGGERQRVAVARALIMEPALILADEPTGALDRTNSESLMDLLLEINSIEKATLVLVTHSPFCAERMEREISLLDGVVVT